MQKIIFIIEKITKYRKCPALHLSTEILQQCDQASWDAIFREGRTAPLTITLFRMSHISFFLKQFINRVVEANPISHF